MLPKRMSDLDLRDVGAPYSLAAPFSLALTFSDARQDSRLANHRCAAPERPDQGLAGRL
jgi:hypothetical protein